MQYYLPHSVDYSKLLEDVKTDDYSADESKEIICNLISKNSHLYKSVTGAYFALYQQRKLFSFLENVLLSQKNLERENLSSLKSILGLISTDSKKSEIEVGECGTYFTTKVKIKRNLKDVSEKRSKTNGLKIKKKHTYATEKNAESHRSRRHYISSTCNMNKNKSALQNDGPSCHKRPRRYACKRNCSPSACESARKNGKQYKGQNMKQLKFKREINEGLESTEYGFSVNSELSASVISNLKHMMNVRVVVKNVLEDPEAQIYLDVLTFKEKYVKGRNIFNAINKCGADELCDDSENEIKRNGPCNACEAEPNDSNNSSDCKPMGMGHKKGPTPSTSRSTCDANCEEDENDPDAGYGNRQQNDSDKSYNCETRLHKKVDFVSTPQVYTSCEIEYKDLSRSYDKAKQSESSASNPSTYGKKQPQVSSQLSVERIGPHTPPGSGPDCDSDESDSSSDERII